MDFRLSDDELFSNDGGGSSAAPSKKSSNPFAISDDELFSGKPEAKRTIKGTLGDVAGTALKSAMGVVDVPVGLADILTGGRVGKTLSDGVAIPGTDAYLRLDTKSGGEVVDDKLTSDAQKAAQQRVDDAGKDDPSLISRTGKKALEMVKNPSTIAVNVGESLGGIGAGGLASRGLMLLPKLQKIAALGEKGLARAGTLAGAGGEAAVSGAQTAEQVRQDSEDGHLTVKQAALSAGSGLFTGLLSLGGGKLAHKLGIEDIDTLMAGVKSAPAATKKSFAMKVLGGAVTEGLIEELPQSAQEQIAQNWATGKAWDYQLDSAMAGGALAGGAMGAGANIHHALTHQEQPAQSPAQKLADQALVQVRGAGDTLEQHTALRSKVASILADLPEDQRVQAISHMAGGDQAKAEALFQMSQDGDLVQQGKDSPLLDDADTGLLSIRDTIHQHALEAQPAAGDEPAQNAVSPPTANKVADMVTDQPEVRGNTAGYIPEPLPQLQAQVDAVKQGRKPAAFMGEDEFHHIDLNQPGKDPLAYGVARDPKTGETGVFIAATNDEVQKAVDLVDQIGLKPAAGQILGYVNPDMTSAPQPGAAVIQQRDNITGHVIKEEAVSPEQAGHIDRVPGTTVHVTNHDEALASRVAQAPQTEPGSPFPGPATAADQAPATSFQGGVRPEPVAHNYQSEPTDRTRELVERINQHRGAKLAPDSIREVKNVPQELTQMARAIKFATGTKVVYVHGGDEIWGASLGDKNTIYMNVESASPLMTLGHELVHVLQIQHPDLFDKLEEVVLSRVSKTRAEKLRKSLQAATQAEQSDAAIKAYRSELVAEAVGELAQKEDFWVSAFEAVTKDQSKIGEFISTLKEVLQKLRRAFLGQGYIKGAKDIEAVQKAFNKAYAEWSKRYAPQFMAEQEELKKQSDEARKQRTQQDIKGKVAKVAELPDAVRERVASILERVKAASPSMHDAIAMAMVQEHAAGRLTEDALKHREEWVRKQEAAQAEEGKPRTQVEPRKVTVDSMTFRVGSDSAGTGAISALPKPILDAAVKKVQELTDKLAAVGFHHDEVDPTHPQDARDLQNQINRIEGDLHALVGRRYTKMTGKGGEKTQNKTNKVLGELESELSKELGIDTTKYPGVNMDRKISTLGEWASETIPETIKSPAIEEEKAAAGAKPETIPETQDIGKYIENLTDELADLITMRDYERGGVQALEGIQRRGRQAQWSDRPAARAAGRPEEARRPLQFGGPRALARRARRQPRGAAPDGRCLP
jgi:hypothetical protein